MSTPPEDRVIIHDCGDRDCSLVAWQHGPACDPPRVEESGFAPHGGTNCDEAELDCCPACCEGWETQVRRVLRVPSDVALSP